jgi:hypothetical protein
MAARRDRLQVRRSIADKWNLHCGQLELPENHESCQHDLTKNRIAVVLLGSIAPQTYFAELRGGIEPWSLQARHLGGQVL